MSIDLAATADAITRRIEGSGIHRAEVERLLREGAASWDGDVVGVWAQVATDGGHRRLVLLPLVRGAMPAFLGGRFEPHPGVAGPGKVLESSTPATSR